MDYLDFEIEIGPRHGREYPVSVLHSLAGEPRSTLHLPYAGEGLKLRLALLENALLRSGATRTRKVTAPEERPVQSFGQMLFEALFTEPLLASYDATQQQARLTNAGVRLKLRVQAPDLATLPWEFLYDPRQDEYLCLSRRTPVVRYVSPTHPLGPLKVVAPLRILGMIASPAGLPALDVLAEKERLEAALRGLTSKGQVDLHWLERQTWDALRDAMLQGTWHVLHFIGHGGYDAEADEGLLALANETGQQHLLTATQVAHLLADHDDLRLVVLNACEGARGSERDLFSSTAARLVRSGGVPAVVAMQYAISDEAAIQFGARFYAGIAQGMPVDAATAEARIGMSVVTRESAEWGTPVLYMQSPDGRIFDIAPPPGGQPVAPEEPVTDGKVDAGLEEDRRRQAQLGERYAIGRRSFDASHWSGAIEQLEVVFALDPTYKDTAALLDQAHRQQRLADLYDEARALCQHGAWQPCLNTLERIKAVDPAYPDADRLGQTAREGLAAEARETRRPVAPASPEAPRRRRPSVRWWLAAALAVAIVGTLWLASGASARLLGMQQTLVPTLSSLAAAVARTAQPVVAPANPPQRAPGVSPSLTSTPSPTPTRSATPGTQTPATTSAPTSTPAAGASTPAPATPVPPPAPTREPVPVSSTVQSVPAPPAPAPPGPAQTSRP